ncbi:MAG TPA: hypothetical protein VJA25_11170 [Dehalococcoidia bacterium]|nr:hypothetical protein [Dehalococcoidia bacterium]
MPGKPGGAPSVPIKDQTLAMRLALQIMGGTAGLLGGRATQSPVKSSSAFYMGKDNKGRSVYRVALITNTGRRVNQVVSWDGRTIRPPNFSATAREGGIGPPDLSATSTTEAAALRRGKDNALAWIATNSARLAATDVTGMSRWIQGFSGDPQEFNRRWVFMRNNLPALTGVGVEDFAIDDSWMDGLFGGGGGGGGFAGPEYREPDRRVVEDFVKGSLVSLVGNIPSQYVNAFTDLFMKDHRRNFDSLDKEIDPQQSVIAAIRRTAEYKTIHNLRPQGVDERDWVSDRKSQAVQGGLNTGDIEDFAITQATVGADIGDVAEAAAFAQLQGSGQAPAFLQSTFRNVATGIFAGVGR